MLSSLAAKGFGKLLSTLNIKTITSDLGNTISCKFGVLSLNDCSYKWDK